MIKIENVQIAGWEPAIRGMRDPDYTFSVDETGGYIVPLSWQLDALGLYHEVFRRNDAGKLMYSRRLLVDCDEGMWSWLKALREQGFPVGKE